MVSVSGYADAVILPSQHPNKSKENINFNSLPELEELSDMFHYLSRTCYRNTLTPQFTQHQITLISSDCWCSKLVFQPNNCSEAGGGRVHQQLALQVGKKCNVMTKKFPRKLKNTEVIYWRWRSLLTSRKSTRHTF